MNRRERLAKKDNCAEEIRQNFGETCVFPGIPAGRKQDFSGWAGKSKTAWDDCKIKQFIINFLQHR